LFGVALSTLILIAVIAVPLILTRTDWVGKVTHKIGVPPPDPQIGTIILALIASGTVFFLAAHLFLFKLYHPARYTQLSVNFVWGFIWSLAGALALIAILRALFNLRHAALWVALLMSGAALVLFVILLERKTLSDAEMARPTKSPGLHAFLRATPPNTMIASFEPETDSVPAYSRRSVYFALELLVPYKKRYYEALEARVLEFAQVWHNEKLEPFRDFVRRSGVDFVLIANGTPSLEGAAFRTWLRNFPAITSLIQDDKKPFYYGHLTHCVVFHDESLSLVDAHCLSSQEKSQKP
jgi:hypothetical protein